jgi:hypothetical protein
MAMDESKPTHRCAVLTRSKLRDCEYRIVHEDELSQLLSWCVDGYEVSLEKIGALRSGRWRRRSRRCSTSVGREVVAASGPGGLGKKFERSGIQVEAVTTLECSDYPGPCGADKRQAKVHERLKRHAGSPMQAEVDGRLGVLGRRGEVQDLTGCVAGRRGHFR